MKLFYNLPYLTAFLLNEKCKVKGWRRSAVLATLTSLFVNDKIEIDGDYDSTIKMIADRKRVQMAKNREKIGKKTLDNITKE